MSGLNIADIFETVVATAPERSAVVVRTCDGRNEVRLTFAELDARVNQLAHALLELGVGVGDHVGCHLYDGNQDAMDGFARVNSGVTSPAEFFSDENVGRIFAAAQ